MKHFTFKQCALALCLGLASFLPGQSIATNAPDVSRPIGMELAAQEESGYAFASWNTHAEYTKIYRDDNGYSGNRGKEMQFLLPENAEGVYLKVSLQNTTQASLITFQVNNQDLAYTEEGVTWITPTDCNKEGSTQRIPFGARATFPGVYTYTIEAYVNQDDAKPVDTWESTFYFMENLPTLSVPLRIHSDNFFIDVNKGDLAENTYIEVEHEYTIAYHDAIDFSADGFTASDGRWVNQPKRINNEHIECHLTTKGKGAVRFCIRLKDETGTTICEERPEALYPFNPSSKDVETLQALAKQNTSCTELVEYVEQEQWNQNITELKSVRVGWSMSNPTYITSIEFIDHEETLTLDLLAQLDSLEELWLLGNNNITAPLNLSPLSKLKEVRGLSNLTYQDITFPANFDKTKVSGTSIIRKIGTPREDGTVEVPNNTIINLADYVGTDVAGCKMTYTWLRNWDEVTLTLVAENSFKLHGEPGEWLRCEIKNDSFPNWDIQTERIYLVQGELKYDSADVAGLMKLATDNPQNEEIKTFIESGLWKESNLYPDNSPMGVKWVVDENNNARLSHLRLNLHDCYQESIAPTKMDLSAFTELVYFNTSSNYYIDKMDFSYNTKLEEIRLEYAYTMTSVDLSPCKNLKTLWLNHLNVMETVDLSANTKLEYLRVDDDRVLRSLDLSALSNLTTLNVSWCSNLSQLSDLSKHTLLKELTIVGCWDLKTLPGLDKLSLESLSFAHTDSMYKEALKTVNFAEMTYLNYAGSNYSLPDSGKAPKLETIQLPQTLKELNLNHYLNLRQLWAYGDPSTVLPYSGIKNYRNRSYWDEQGNYHEGVSYEGSSLIPMPGAKKVLGERYPCIEPEDTIDLSSEAIFNGKESHFIWIDCDDNTEVKDLFVAIKDQPGLFKINPEAALNESGAYRCKIWNEAFSDGAGVDWNNGWILDTEHFKIPNGSSYYDPKELELLQKIVEQSGYASLKEYWEQGGWVDSYSGYWFEEDETNQYNEFYFSWNDNHRLKELRARGTEMKGLLNLSAAKELEYLFAEKTNFTDCVFPANPSLKYISFEGSNIILPIDREFPALQSFYPGKAQMQVDMSKLPALKSIYTSYSSLKFSGIISPRKGTEWGIVWGYNWLTMSDKVYANNNFFGTDEQPVIDLSAEVKAGAKIKWSTQDANWVSTDINPTEPEPGKYKLGEALLKYKTITGFLTHDSFPSWHIYLYAKLYTLPGDANIDGKVNVQDISATLPYILEDYDNRSAIFGEYQADMDKNQAIEVADVIGIVNTIRGVTNPVMKSTFQPIVYVTSEADGKLYVDTQVPLAGLQLTFTGVEQEIPLLGEAAHFAHAAHASDSLRMVAYSMDGGTIPAGRTLLAQLPKGATLVEALFSDANAQSLKANLSGIVTATEEIGNDLATQQVTNYPNPFHGQTTFTYGVQEQADQAVIRIYATNGALVRVLTGLPVAPGENQYRATIDLPAGLYLYRLEISRAGRVISTQTNNLIIK